MGVVAFYKLWQINLAFIFVGTKKHRGSRMTLLHVMIMRKGGGGGGTHNFIFWSFK